MGGGYLVAPLLDSIFGRFGNVWEGSGEDLGRFWGNFNMQNLANTTWAFATFATAGESDVQLLASSGQVATLGQWEAVFAALAMAAERCVADFETQDIANMA